MPFASSTRFSGGATAAALPPSALRTRFSASREKLARGFAFGRIAAIDALSGRR